MRRYTIPALFCMLLAVAATLVAQQAPPPLPSWTTPIVAALEINPDGLAAGLATIRAQAAAGNLNGVTTRQVDMFTSAVLQIPPPRRRDRVPDYVRRVVDIIDGPLGDEHATERSTIVARMINGSKNMVGTEATRLAAIAAGTYTYTAPQ